MPSRKRQSQRGPSAAGAGSSSQHAATTPALPLPLSAVTSPGPPPSPGLPPSPALPLSPRSVEISPQWMEVSRWVTPELKQFWESRRGKQFVRWMDARMSAVRAENAQPNPQQGQQIYSMPRSLFIEALEELLLAYRLQYRMDVNSDDYAFDLDQLNFAEIPMVAEALFTRIEAVRDLLVRRYEKPDLRDPATGTLRPNYPYALRKEAGDRHNGWEELRKGTGSVPVMLTNLLLNNSSGYDPQFVYVVDGNNLFYNYNPVDWPAELRRDRNGDYGPVVIYMKNHMFVSKLLHWLDGGCYIYNALQEMHGGARLNHPVYVVSIEVKNCNDQVRSACLEHQKKEDWERNPDTGKLEGKCRVLQQDGRALNVPYVGKRQPRSEWDHLLCEFDDVAANMCLEQLREAVQAKNRLDGGRREAVFVTTENNARYLKNEYQIDAVNVAMRAMTQNISTRVYSLKSL